MRGLEGRTYIVTGAASGIGRATASRLLDEGASVMGADVTDEPAAAPGRVAEGARWSFTRCDVTDEEAVSTLVRAAVSLGGAVDGLVNAAGVAGGGPVHMLPAEEWARVITINLTGTFLTAKHVIAQMLRQPARADGSRGSVVTVASIEGLEGTAGGSAYSASKGGVVILTKNMAIDYAGRGIRVNALCPGFIETPMTAAVFGPGMEATLADVLREHKLGRRMGRRRRSPRPPLSCCPMTRRS
jgi:NAD(P)-dependent dehydrogenase (short-subunit alcohol dehydrogenase family)